MRAHLLSACKHGGLLEPGARQWERREEEREGGTRDRGREKTLCRSHRLYAVLLACPRQCLLLWAVPTLFWRAPLMWAMMGMISPEALPWSSHGNFFGRAKGLCLPIPPWATTSHRGQGSFPLNQSNGLSGAGLRLGQSQPRRPGGLPAENCS